MRKHSFSVTCVLFALAVIPRAAGQGPVPTAAGHWEAGDPDTRRGSEDRG